MKQKKRKARFIVVDGDKVLYRSKEEDLARTFQNGCGRPGAVVIKARTVWRRPWPIAGNAID